MLLFELAWLIPALPLLGFVLITCTPIRRSGPASGWLTIVLMLAATALALGVALSIGPAAHAAGEGGFAFPAPSIVRSFRWLPAGNGAPLTMGFYVDPAVALMLVMVTVVSSCIHLFSLGYMAHDERQARFFAFIALFTAAMLLMLIASNLLLFFMAWEIMGLASYLLIGFWYDRDYPDPAQITPRQAAIKAFITTRIGDVLLMLGLVYLWWQAGTMDFGSASGQIFNPDFLSRIASTPAAFGMSAATVIALLIFAGTIGKSAQFPLHVWLPDAMEGPTPVSALIHAATMVAAGVFLVARTFPIFVASDALPVVALVGTITALGAALVACAQFDLKRILAYSTLSQLGFMVAALGTGGWVAALFHLVAHAFFKALLFLGAGSVIHGMESTVGQNASTAQDIRNMGGLRRFMPVTFWTYVAGYLALVGFPPFAGFWSKDEILAHAFGNGSYLVFGALLLAAFLTAFYMTRQVLLVFFGEFRGHTPRRDTRPSEPKAVGHGPPQVEIHDDGGEHAVGGRDPHESVWTMLVPLAVLAAFALFGGFANTPWNHWLSDYVGMEAGAFSPGVAVLATALTLAGMAFGWLAYRGAFVAAHDADPLERSLGGMFGFLNRRMQFDELYAATFGRLTSRLALAFDWLDAGLLLPLAVGIDRLGRLFGEISFIADDTALNDGADTLADGTGRSGDRLRRSETGVIQDYGALIFGGVVVIGAVFLYALR